MIYKDLFPVHYMHKAIAYVVYYPQPGRQNWKILYWFNGEPVAMFIVTPKYFK